MIGFRSVLDRHEASEFDRIEAGAVGISARTFRRWWRRYEEEGEVGLLDRRLGHTSPKRVPADAEAEIERLYHPLPRIHRPALPRPAGTRSPVLLERHFGQSCSCNRKACWIGRRVGERIAASVCVLRYPE
jgi:hypothetical protein